MHVLTVRTESGQRNNSHYETQPCFCGSYRSLATMLQKQAHACEQIHRKRCLTVVIVATDDVSIQRGQVLRVSQIECVNNRANRQLFVHIHIGCTNNVIIE